MDKNLFKWLSCKNNTSCMINTAASVECKMEERELPLAWFAAASAKYLDLGLTTKQRICLYRECFDIASKENDSKLLRLRKFLLATVSGQITSNSRECGRQEEYEESDEKLSKTKAWQYLGNAQLENEHDVAMLYDKTCLAITQETRDKEAEVNTYNTLATTFLEKEEYDDAILYSKKYLAIAQESDNKNAEMNAYKMLADAHLKKDEYDDAILYGKKNLAIAQESDNKNARMDAYKTLADAHCKKEEYDDAIFYGKKLLAIAQEYGNRNAEMNAYNTLATAHLEKEEYDDAISYGKKCLALSQESDNNNAKMDAYKTLADAHLQKEEYDDAISYGKKCLALAQESDNKNAQVIAYNTLTVAHFKKEEYDDVLSYGKYYLAIPQHSHYKVADMSAYNTLAFAHLKKGEYDDAIAYDKKLLALAQEYGHRNAEMDAYSTLADAHLQKEEYGDAISYGKKRLAIAQESGNRDAEMNAYNTLAFAHLKKEEYDDVISYGKKLLAIAQETGNRNAEMNGYNTLADAHLKKEEYDEAISYGKKLLAIAQESGNRNAEMNAYNTLADAHLKKEEYDDVISYEKYYLAIAQETGNKVAEMNAYIKLAETHYNKEEYDEAKLYRKKYLAIAQESGDKVAEMNAYKTFAVTHCNKEEYDEAILYRKKYLAIAQESGDKVAEIQTYQMLVIEHRKKEEYDNSILCCKKLLAIAQKCGDKVAETNAYNLLAVNHLEKEEYDDALSYGKYYLAIAQESGDKVAEMNAYNTLANAHLKKEEYDDVLSYGKYYLAIAQESGDKVAEMNAYNTLADAHMKKEEYDEVISYGKKLLAIAQESRNGNAEMNAYYTLAVAHLKKEEYDDVIFYGKKLLAIAEEYCNKKTEINAYMILGFVHMEKEEYDDAHSWFTEGMKTAEDQEDIKSINIFGWFLSNIYAIVGLSEEYKETFESAQNHAFDYIPKRKAQTWFPRFHDSYASYEYHRAQHDYEQAITYLEEAKKTAETEQENEGIINFPLPLWPIKYELSEMYVLLGNYDKGMQCFQDLLDAESKKLQQAMCHFRMGEIHYKLKQFENAKKSFKESLMCCELIFDGLKQNDRFKIAFVEKHKNAYKMLLKVLIETNMKVEALVLSDHYRAKALKDLLVSRYGMKKEPIARDGLQYADVQSLVFNRNYSLLLYSTCFEKLGTFLVEAGNELELSIQPSEYCGKCLDDLVNQAFKDMKVRQVVNCADGSLGVMDDSKENRNPKEDELTRLLTRQIEKSLSEQCRSICGCRKQPSESTDESSLTGLEILYRKFIKNIKCLIKQEEVVIIAEGPSCKVPFAALRDPDTGQYLSETKRIRVAPSMATLKLLQECPEKHYTSKEALIIGDPLVGQVMLAGKKKEIPQLKGALNEAKCIAHILGVQPLLETNATKPAVVKRLKEGASVVHIAAHGILSKATIVLAPSSEIRATKIPDEEDYMLTMADVQQAKVRAQLVVLSCCYSGRGEIKAEGVVGMCRAFLASGARAVVGSLWAVDDDATWMFMETFYKYLKDGKSASTSLHLTMNDMRRTSKYSDPKFWAPFFLMGDDVTINFED